MRSLSRVRLFATPWTAAYQALLSMGFPGKSAGVDCHFLLQSFKKDFLLKKKRLPIKNKEKKNFQKLKKSWIHRKGSLREKMNPGWSVLRRACLCPNCFSCLSLFATPWTVVHQAPLSMGSSRQEYWSVLPCLPPGSLPAQGSNSGLLQCRQILYHWATWEAPTLRHS